MDQSEAYKAMMSDLKRLARNEAASEQAQRDQLAESLARSLLSFDPPEQLLCLSMAAKEALPVTRGAARHANTLRRIAGDEAFHPEIRKTVRALLAMLVADVAGEDTIDALERAQADA